MPCRLELLACEQHADTPVSLLDLSNPVRFAASCFLAFVRKMEDHSDRCNAVWRACCRSVLQLTNTVMIITEIMKFFACTRSEIQ